MLWGLVLTWPLLLHPLGQIPLGDENAGTVPLFNLWTLQWNVDQLTHGYPHYWDAPIFAPTQGTFAFSEPQPLSALLAVPLWLFSVPGGYNFLVVLFLTLNGWFACWLLRQWRLPLPASVLGGMLVQSLPVVAQEMGVLQLVAVFGVLWSLLFLSRFLAESRRGLARWSTVVGLGLGPPVTFFTCGYYGLFSMFFLPLAFVAQLHRRLLDRDNLYRLLLVGLLALVLTVPFLGMQYQALRVHNFSRSVQTIKSNSAHWQDYTKFLDHNILYGKILSLHSAAGQRLGPGIGLAVLALLGLAGAGRRRIKLYLLMAVGLALGLSLGLRLEVGGWQPYQALREFVPGLRMLRSPFRFAVMVQLHLALLAGFGLFNLQRWFKRGTLISVIAAGLVVFESLALPLPLQPMPPLQTHAGWQNWLNRLDAPPIVLMLPFAASGRVDDFEPTVVWMLESRYFQGRLVNGYSGFFPRYHPQLRQLLVNFPSENSLALLRALRVDYVIVYHRLPGAPPPSRLAHDLVRLFYDQKNNVSIYRLSPAK